MTHILRALDKDGNEFFYTGRAGEGWISANMGEAFPYSLEGARNKAIRFNEAAALHGLWFIALDPKLREAA